jgi:hypothetical protein
VRSRIDSLDLWSSNQAASQLSADFEWKFRPWSRSCSRHARSVESQASAGLAVQIRFRSLYPWPGLSTTSPNMNPLLSLSRPGTSRCNGGHCSSQFDELVICDASLMFLYFFLIMCEYVPAPPFTSMGPCSFSKMP